MSTPNFKFETELHFCFRPTCCLHVRPGDPGVQGEGNWARIDGGLIIGRRLIDGAYLCDLCIGADEEESVA